MIRMDQYGYIRTAYRVYQKSIKQPVGRESEAHPAISISIIPSIDAERYHLPPIQGYKCRFQRSGESWNTANPRPS